MFKKIEQIFFYASFKLAALYEGSRVYFKKFNRIKEKDRVPNQL